MSLPTRPPASLPTGTTQPSFTPVPMVAVATDSALTTYAAVPGESVAQLASATDSVLTTYAASATDTPTSAAAVATDSALPTYAATATDNSGT